MNQDINKFIFLLRKAIYPYEYIDSWERSDETLLPNKEDFYKEDVEDITGVDNRHERNIYIKI